MSSLGVEESRVVQEALLIVENQMQSGKESMSSSIAAKQMAILKLASLRHEVFTGFMLDNQHRLIEFRVFFTGTINACAVYPREIVRACLEINAAAMIFAHNHPSGDVKPSGADKHITKQMTEALALIDVRVLDHIIVAGNDCYSFMDAGIMP